MIDERSTASDPEVQGPPLADQEPPLAGPVDDIGAPGGEPPEASDVTPPARPEPAGDDAAEEPDYRDLYLRAAAELENVRKRARRDVALADARGVGRLARELLPALDNFERALAAAEAEEPDEEHHLTKGIRLVQSELLAALTRLGIEPYSPKGERFDPHLHEAVAQQPVDGVEPGTVAEVYQAGYRFREEILRPAKVVVAG